MADGDSFIRIDLDVWVYVVGDGLRRQIADYLATLPADPETVPWDPAAFQRTELPRYFRDVVIPLIHGESYGQLFGPPTEEAYIAETLARFQQS